MTLNADGYPVITANSTATISTHNGSLQILYSSVTDYGSISSRDYKISINVIAPDVPWWGVKDSADGNGKTLYLAGEEVPGKADTPDESILNGFASWSDAPWYSYKNDIVKVEILETSKKIKLNSSERLFGSLSYVTSLTGLKNLDMTNVKKASLMFAHFGRYGSGCTADIQNLTTSTALNATNQMFYYAHFTSFNPTGMNTEEVTTFDEMFGGFSINDGIMDLSSFSNNKANNIGSMFWQVTNVTTIYADSSK
ncbi:MAG: hypothetical protein Q4F54_04615 [Coriobacteriia bacterium]|nr:hypothetical protein [Coriobacteriia bacterium]